MNHVRIPIVLCLVAVLLAAGCTSPPAQTQGGEKTPGGATQQTCTMVSEQVPVTTQECTNISLTEQVCGKKTLQYTQTLRPRVDLCIGDGPCVGMAIGDCPATCNKIMTRCVLDITNQDPLLSGTWTVGANFTLKNSAFIKDPVTKTIGPNQSFAFDFFQMYSTMVPMSTADCNLYVIKEAVVDDCHEETHLDRKCENVTSFETRQRQVCQ